MVMRSQTDSKITFDEQLLEDVPASRLPANRHPYFMFRDFQTRNIAIKAEPCFIDYQGEDARGLQSITTCIPTLPG